MNRERRKAIDAVFDQLEELKGEIERIREEEEEYFENMPESIQYGEKGELAEASIEELDNAYNSIGDAMQALEGAK